MSAHVWREGLHKAPVQIIVPSFLHPVPSDKVVAVARLLPVRLHVNKAGSTSCPVTTDPDMPAAAVRVVPGNPNSMAMGSCPPHHFDRSDRRADFDVNPNASVAVGRKQEHTYQSCSNQGFY